ncbi:hypothetical protein BDZ89DRAFT_1109706 [Hymenopellis radicata]|nr:hypothetical protein BDZ89DRAFT_1109706 [Hymenopellis radicata]
MPVVAGKAKEASSIPRSLCQFERAMGDTEASYFLPSRENGVNDMYLHLGFTAPPRLTSRSRVSLVWALLRLRHPILASHVIMHNYKDIRFLYKGPASVQEAIDDANRNLEYRNEVTDDLLDGYLNGPRTLSNERLSYLIISPTGSNDSIPSPPPTPRHNGNHLSHNHDVLICATHFIGDGMALHNLSNDFFTLLGGPNDEEALRKLLVEEWNRRCNKPGDASTLPLSLEELLPEVPDSAFHRAASRVDFQNVQRKQIGGQAFPKQSGKPRHTVIRIVSIDEDRTKRMLKTCKANRVSISSAVFALCNIAWARASQNRGELPSLMYSALNLRPNLRAEKALCDSYWFLAIGYFNIILPTFLPKSKDVSKTFWHRARLAKEQSTVAAKSPMIVSRSRLTAEERGTRARVWAKEDDDKANGVWTPPPPKAKTSEVRVPSTALIGLSLLGNLDGIYKHVNFGEIKLHTLTTGSRQRSGGMLLFGYTFVGKLWINLGYDENGFEESMVKKFWEELLVGVDEFLDN